MSIYLSAFVRAVFGHGVWVRLAHIGAAAILGGGALADYTNLREKIDKSVGFELMPRAPTLWVLFGILAVSIIVRLAHSEAMRRWRAANIVFGKPYRVESPLFRTDLIPSAGAEPVRQRTKVHDFYAVKVDVRNCPYKGDEGKDVGDAWSLFELFDLDLKHIASWREGRWEDNKQPGYGNHPIDHYPDDQKIRTLSANGRPNILCVAIKPVADSNAYPFRGVDQIEPDWRAKDINIPPGNYLLRLTINGKGLVNPAQCIFEFRNEGANNPIELLETKKKI